MPQSRTLGPCLSVSQLSNFIGNFSYRSNCSYSGSPWPGSSDCSCPTGLWLPFLACFHLSATPIINAASFQIEMVYHCSVCSLLALTIHRMKLQVSSSPKLFVIWPLPSPHTSSSPLPKFIHGQGFAALPASPLNTHTSLSREVHRFLILCPLPG